MGNTTLVKKLDAFSGQSDYTHQLDIFSRQFDSDTGGSPSNGKFQINNADYSLATEIELSVFNNVSQDETVIIDTVTAGDIIKLTAFDHPERNVVYTATSVSVGGVITVDFETIGDEVPFIDNEFVSVAVLKGAGFVAPWKTVNKVFGDFTAAALTTTIVGYALADGEDFTSVRAIVGTAFSGPAITSVIMSVGIAGQPQLFIPNFDAAQTATDFWESNFDPIMGEVGGTDIEITITVIGADLDTLDDGAIVFKFKTSQS